MDRVILYKKMHAMLGELGIAYSKEFLLEGYGVASTKELSDADLSDLVEKLSDMKRQKSVNEILRKLRSENLCILQRMGIYTNNESWHRVNAFLLDPKIAGKLLYKMTTNELIQLKTKLHAIESKKKDQVKAELRLAQLN